MSKLKCFYEKDLYNNQLRDRSVILLLLSLAVVLIAVISLILIALDGALLLSSSASSFL